MALIETNSLTLRYSPQVTALADLTVSLEPGVIGLVGANGAGKSTFIKVVLGLLSPTSGTVRVLGLDPLTQAERVRSLVGYMPENDCLPPDISAADLVTHLGRISGLPRSVARERTSETLRHVGLYEERYRAVGGYSTGMKQRVKLAQAMVHDPDLLLLDEPTNGLDPAGRDGMLELIHRIGTEFGISIIVCSHLLGEIERICGSLVAIEGGRLLRSSSVSSMTSQKEQLAIEVADFGESAEAMERLTKRLTADGLAVSSVQQTLLVPLDGDHVFDQIVAAAADLNVPLHRIEQRRHKVAELFAEETEPVDVTD